MSNVNVTVAPNEVTATVETQDVTAVVAPQDVTAVVETQDVTATVQETVVNVVLADIGPQGPAGTTQWEQALTLPFRVRDHGRTWLRLDRVATTEAPLNMFGAADMVGVSWSLSKVDPANGFELQIYKNGTLQRAVSIPAGQQSGIAAFSDSYAQNDQISAALAFSSGSGVSTFCAGSFLLRFRE